MDCSRGPADKGGQNSGDCECATSNAGRSALQLSIRARALLFTSRTGVAKILTFAALAEARVLLEILRCTTLVQKFILLRGFLPQPRARLST